ncbi:MAG: DUF1080 domain-containing protein [Aureliella sp.]
MRTVIICIWLMLAIIPTNGWSQDAAVEDKQAKSDKTTSESGQVSEVSKVGEAKPTLKWKSLLPAEGLEGWEVSDFGSQGVVRRDGELLVFEKGTPLTGINYKLTFPKENYELEFSAQRMEGNDFLCGLTFPVADEFCSFIGGGWGGGVVGLSSVDGYDAAENATSLYHTFENKRWYKFRLRVDPTNITGWIDDKQVVQQERAGHKFSTRIEVYVSRPLGLCAFSSKVALRDLRFRELTAAEQTP